MSQVVHRDLRLTSPHATGPDVKALQVALNARMKARHEGQIDADGEYGPATAGAVRQVGWDLGALPQTLDKGCPRGLAELIEDPSKRTPDQLARAKQRAETPRGPQAAIAWARTQIGTKESPPNSNRGPKIDVWNGEVQSIGGPWCGAFAHAALEHGGVKTDPSIRYCPSIEAMAKQGTGGFASWHPGVSNAQPGDLVLYDWFKNPPSFPDHVGVVVALQGNELHTIEGNTSSGTAGSQSDGGGVFARVRPTNQFIVGTARPRW